MKQVVSKQRSLITRTFYYP
jgi:hypothetical protein